MQYTNTDNIYALLILVEDYFITQVNFLEENVKISFENKHLAALISGFVLFTHAVTPDGQRCFCNG